MSRLKKPKINFTQVSNCVLVDPKLSLKAKGLYCNLISKTDDYNFSADRIAFECKENRTTILGILKELEDRMYLCRVKNNDGTIDYMLYNMPAEHPLYKVEPESENPTLQTNTAELEKPTVVKSNFINNTDKLTNTNSFSIEDEFFKVFKVEEQEVHLFLPIFAFIKQKVKDSECKNYLYFLETYKDKLGIGGNFDLSSKMKHGGWLERFKAYQVYGDKIFSQLKQPNSLYQPKKQVDRINPYSFRSREEFNAACQKSRDAGNIVEPETIIDACLRKWGEGDRSFIQEALGDRKFDIDKDEKKNPIDEELEMEIKKQEYLKSYGYKH